MKEKMTSGEIAKQAGVSTKALRVYDEKGLLKPVGLSEGNYKLYDKSSLIILEKIIALKHIGFSLEEIKSSLEDDDQSYFQFIVRGRHSPCDTTAFGPASNGFYNNIPLLSLQYRNSFIFHTIRGIRHIPYTFNLY